MLSAIEQYLAVQIANQVTLYNVVENLQTVLKLLFPTNHLGESSMNGLICSVSFNVEMVLWREECLVVDISMKKWGNSSVPTE